jgi:hypothetical protein
MHIFHTYRYRLLLTDMFTVSNLWALVELCEARRSRDTGAEEGPSDSEAFRCILWYSVFKEHELEWNQDTTNPWHVSRCNVESTQSSRSSILLVLSIRHDSSMSVSQILSIFLNLVLSSYQPEVRTWIHAVPMHLECFTTYNQLVSCTKRSSQFIHNQWCSFFQWYQISLLEATSTYVLSILHPTLIPLQKLCRGAVQTLLW